MRFGIRFLSTVLLTGVFVAGAACAQRPVDQTQDGVGLHLVATSEIAADLIVGDEPERVTGRASFHLAVPKSGLQEGAVAVRGFNVAFFGVSQQRLAGRARIRQPLGVLAFGTTTRQVQFLRYNAEERTLTGELEMFADASFLNEFAEPLEDTSDVFQTPVMPAKASVRISLEEPLPREAREPLSIRTELDMMLETTGLKYRDFDFPPFIVRLREPVPIPVDIGHILFVEPAQKLCIQPVRLLRFTWSPSRFPFHIPFISFSGAGLAFGEPGARTEWRKNDLVFEIRGWKTLWSDQFWVLGSPEEDDLRPLVEDDDCVEVFFVYGFDPVDRWGGGATFGCGVASSQVITSDGNARGGIDFTHLAHELGHVVGLHHPGAGGTGTCQPASTGTLLCPSGFLNDNPQVNSQENQTLLSNPLLTFTFKLRGPGPDCVNSGDCGACP